MEYLLGFLVVVAVCVWIAILIFPATKEETCGEVIDLPVISPVIGEPTKSLIKTIEDGEWEFIRQENDGAMFTAGFYIVATHCWTRDSFKVFVGWTAICLEEWMTQVEKDVVGKVCYQMYDRNLRNQKAKNDYYRRQEFMKFVKEQANETI